MAKSLAGYMPESNKGNFVAMSEIENETVVVRGFYLGQGQFGETARMNITRATGEDVVVSTTSTYIIGALQDAKKDKAFPCDAKFVKHGKAWWVEEPDTDEISF
jgi:hypothetical protein